MSYQVLARKWRPRNFTEMVGQSHVLKVLSNALDTNRLHHAYLFTGTRGVGKTTLARILAKCLNCEKGVTSEPCGECSACVCIDEGRFVDLIEVDAASRAKVDETRDLMDNVQYAPTSGRYKVYLIDEVHMFSNHSFNALLKTLEEPPPHVKFLLATTEPKKLPITILSRCLQFNLKHLSVEQIVKQLAVILEQENIIFDDTSIRLIAVSAKGSMRDALSLLDQAIAYGNGELREAQLREMLGTIDSVDLTGLLKCLVAGDAEGVFKQIDKMSAFSPDYDAVLTELLTSLHNIAVAQVLPERSDVIDNSILSLIDEISKEDVQLYYQIGLNGKRDLIIAPDPSLGFEMTMIRMLAFRPVECLDNQVDLDRSISEAHKKEILEESTKEKLELKKATPANNSWQNIIDEMALTGLVKELAGHCMLKEHTDEKVHLVLLPSQEHLLRTMQKERLHDAIKVRFGQHVKLVLSVDTPEQETPSQRKIRETQEKKESAVRSLEDDPNVATLLETFDATLDKASIRPRDKV